MLCTDSNLLKMSRSGISGMRRASLVWALPVAMLSTACFQMAFLIILRNGQISLNSNYSLVSWGAGFAIFVFPTLCGGIVSALFHLQTRMASTVNIALGLSYCVFVWATLIVILNASFRSYDFLLPLGMICFAGICFFLIFSCSVIVEKTIVKVRKAY